RAEGPPGLKDYSDVKLPANTPNVLTHPNHIRYHHQWFLLLLLFLIPPMQETADTSNCDEERFNRDGGLEVPGCWIAVMRRQGGRSNPYRPLTSNDVYPQ
ncbi:hypothetical protein, partial [Lacisediminihabitans profunda]|uniref:hypothetical protein n=1 Tax=Lacisediminihabitans profunda TaxID=2594790 RepID=UPI001C9C2D6F